MPNWEYDDGEECQPDGRGDSFRPKMKLYMVRVPVQKHPYIGGRTVGPGWYNNKGYRPGRCTPFGSAQVFYTKSGASQAANRSGGVVVEFEIIEPKE